MIGKYALLIGLLAIVLFAQRFLRISYKKLKHRRNISTGEKVIRKLRSFEGNYRNQQILTYLRKISPYVFEELLLSCLVQKGYKVKRNKSYSGDGGLDGLFFHDNQTILIQAKRYSNQIKPSHLNDFSNLIQKKKADGGWFIHTGTTSVKIYNQYKGSAIKIISGDKLIDLILECEVNLTKQATFRQPKINAL